MPQRTLYEADWSVVNIPGGNKQHVAGSQSVKQFPLDITISDVQLSHNPQAEPCGDESSSDEEDEPGVSQKSLLNHLLSYPWEVLTWAVRWTDPKSQKFVKWCQKMRRSDSAVSVPPIAWHSTKPQLAALSDTNMVQVYDMQAVRMPDGSQAADLRFSSNDGFVPTAISRMATPLASLQYERNNQVLSLAWRPQAREELAAGCTGCVVLWKPLDDRISKIPHHQEQIPRSGLSEGDAQWMPTVLPVASGWPVTALAWHPKGHFLAAGCLNESTLVVWDMRRLQHGSDRRQPSIVGGIQMLRWSPCGCYLFVGCTDGTFMIYETLSWEWKVWGHRECGHLIDAHWSYKSSSPLLLLFCSQQIVSVHLTEVAPGLHAQLVPLDARQVFEPHSEASASEPRPPIDPNAPSMIDSVAWDSIRERLVIGLSGLHPLAGQALLFVTSQEPVTKAVCVGPIYLPQDTPYDTSDPEIEAASPYTYRRDGAPRMKQLQLHSMGAAGTLLACRSTCRTAAVIPMAVRDVTGSGLLTMPTRR